MNKKTIITGIGIFAASFLVLLAAAYFLYPVIEPEEAEKVEQTLAEEQTPVEDLDLSLENLSEVSDSTAAEGDSLLSADTPGQPETGSRIELVEANYVSTIDSLQAVINDMQLVCEQKLEESRQQTLSEEIEYATKALLSLDEEKLAPIVNRFSVNELIKVYRSSSNMQREKLLSVLEPETASQILILVMS